MVKIEEIKKQLRTILILTVVIIGLVYYASEMSVEIKERRERIAEAIKSGELEKIKEEKIKEEKKQNDKVAADKPNIVTFPGLIEDWGAAAPTMIGLDQLITINQKPQPSKTIPSLQHQNLAPTLPPYTVTPTTTNQPKPTPPSKTPNSPAASLNRGRAGISNERAKQATEDLKLKDMSITSDLAKEQLKYFQQKYHISAYKQLPFCVVVPSYNNVAKDRYFHNMNSILQQDYDNYRIIFIDDASDDGTGEKIKQYAKERQIPEEKMTIKINAERQMAMPNLHWAATDFCKPYEIYMIIDGDDELVGKQVFKHFNSIFQQHKVWVTYTNFISIRGSIGYSRPYSQATVDKNNYRHAGFIISHLRAFYTKVFTLIKEEDLKDAEGKWFRAANDVAMYIPILQMSHKHVSYVPEVSYMYNSNTGLNNHRVKLKEQKGNERKVKAKPPYTPLESLFTEAENAELEASMNKFIPLKDLSLPSGDKEKLAWEIDWENKYKARQEQTL